MRVARFVGRVGRVGRLGMLDWSECRLLNFSWGTRPGRSHSRR